MYYAIKSGKNFVANVAIKDEKIRAVVVNTDERWPKINAKPLYSIEEVQSLVDMMHVQLVGSIYTIVEVHID